MSLKNMTIVPWYLAHETLDQASYNILNCGAQNLHSILQGTCIIILPTVQLLETTALNGVIFSRFISLLLAQKKGGS